MSDKNNVPLVDNPSATEFLELETKVEEARKQFKEAVASGDVESFESPLRSFIAPGVMRGTWLVKAGEVISFRDPNSPSGHRDTERTGDVWAEFYSGVCTTDDPLVIEWCEAHSGNKEMHEYYHSLKGDRKSCQVGYSFCRDSRTPNVAVWAELRASQIPTANSDKRTSTSGDIDAFLAGNQSEMPMDPNSAGALFVATAKANENARKAN